MNFVDNILYNNKYLILLLNSFGLVILNFENGEENIYDILKPTINYVNSQIIVKHICIYYIKYLNNINKIFNITSINIITKENIIKILNKSYKIGTYINSPIIIINHIFKYYDKFENLMTRTFVKNMRIDDINKYNIEIYYIEDSDIMDVNITELKLTKVSQFLFLLKIQTLVANEEHIEYKRFLISYEQKETNILQNI